MATKTVRITQIKSAIGYTKKQKDTIKALKLSRLHQTVTHKANPALLGMVDKVKHLLHVEITE